LSALKAATEAALVVPEPERQSLRVRGSEAQSWLNGLVTTDLGGLGPSQGAYALLLNKQGKVQTDLDLLAVADGLVLGVAPGRAGAIREMLDRFLVMEDVELEAVEGVRWLRLFGPRAAAAARELSGAPGVIASGAVDWLGLGGAALLVTAEALDAVAREAVRSAGPTASLATPADWELVRIVQGFPVFGVDYGPDDNPHEASLERRAVSFSKGCYLGQEVVCMQDMRGKVKRRLVVLRWAGGAADARDVFAEGGAEPVGRVISLACDGGACFALARVKAPFFEAPSALRVGEQRAEIVPFAG